MFKTTKISLTDMLACRDSLKQTTTATTTTTPPDKRFKKQNNSSARVLYIFYHISLPSSKTSPKT